MCEVYVGYMCVCVHVCVVYICVRMCGGCGCPCVYKEKLRRSLLALGD